MSLKLAIIGGLLAGLWSASEVCVDPRQVVAGLPGWLSREYGVHFEFGTAVARYERPTVVAGGGTWTAERLFVCSGADLRLLMWNWIPSSKTLRPSSRDHGTSVACRAPRKTARFDVMTNGPSSSTCSSVPTTTDLPRDPPV